MYHVQFDEILAFKTHYNNIFSITSKACVASMVKSNAHGHRGIQSRKKNIAISQKKKKLSQLHKGSWLVFSPSLFLSPISWLRFMYIESDRSLPKKISQKWPKLLVIAKLPLCVCMCVYMSIYVIYIYYIYHIKIRSALFLSSHNVLLLYESQIDHIPPIFYHKMLLVNWGLGEFLPGGNDQIIICISSYSSWLKIWV